MASTGYEFLSRQVDGTVIAGGASVNVETVPVNERWEIHTFSFTADFAIAIAGTFHFELSDSAGANFRQVGPRFSKVANVSVQYNLDTDRETQVPGTPVSETTDAKYVTNFKGMKVTAGQIIRVVDIGGTGDEILDSSLKITGIEETFV